MKKLLLLFLMVGMGSVALLKSNCPIKDCGYSAGDNYDECISNCKAAKCDCEKEDGKMFCEWACNINHKNS